MKWVDSCSGIYMKFHVLCHQPIHPANPMQPVLEPHWIDAFEAILRRCGVQATDTVAILCETQSRPALPTLARLATARVGAKAFTLTLPTVPSQGTPLIRSTGASTAIGGMVPVVQALGASTLVLDCTVEGLMHAPELGAILKAGARVVYVSNEHPEALCRLLPTDDLEPLVKEHTKRMRAAKQMAVRSEAGTDLRISLEGAVVGGNWGYTTRPGTMTHWPGGLVLAFPAAGSVNGRLVLNTGDVNLTFKRYIEQPITLTIENDYVTQIEGTGVDAQLMRDYIAAWGDANAAAGTQRDRAVPSTQRDRAAYAVSHIGYGLNRQARWDSMAMFDKSDFNGTELRAVAGNFLYSTGANEIAKRYTLGHFDLPLKSCTIALDGAVVVERGQVL
jgi:2,5-dihydroxypyridine 5,6-dioxygenase